MIRRVKGLLEAALKGLDKSSSGSASSLLTPSSCDSSSSKSSCMGLIGVPPPELCSCINAFRVAI